jgi:hypothetical protein
VNEEIIKLVIASHKRADNVQSTKAFANAAICVEESQKDAYEEHNPTHEIITHPDSVVGLAAKYKWMHKHFGEMALIGDDIDYLKRTYVMPKDELHHKCSPEDAYEIIQATAFTAKSLGAKMWAFSKESNPVCYSGHYPLRFTGIGSGGVIGLFQDFQMSHITSECTSGLDYFLSGINAHFNRFIFVDERYFTACKEGTFVSRGGMAEHRSIETEKKDYLYLRELFGDVIVPKTNQNLRKKKHGWEKTMKVPF